MEVQGTFNAQRFFDTLAMIISQREGVKVTVTVKQPEPEEKKQRSAEALDEELSFFDSLNVNSSEELFKINDTRYKEEKRK